MHKHVLMSEMEIISNGGCRRRWTAAETLRIVEERLDDRAGISVVARRDDVAPNPVRIAGDGARSEGECYRDRG